MSLTVAELTGGSNSYPTPSKDVQFYLGELLKQGAIGSQHLFVEAQNSPNMTVKVNAGSYILQATPTSEAVRFFKATLSAVSNVNISSNSSGSTKYDLVYVTLPAATLQNPPLTGDFTEAATLLTERHNTSGEALTATNGIVLAEVAVADGAVSITNANITDKREFQADGWITSNETWTYASSVTFTVSGDARNKYRAGDKLRLKQGGAYKYFFVQSVSFSTPTTTITVKDGVTGATTTLANSAITDNYFSRVEYPIGLPAIDVATFTDRVRVSKSGNQTINTGTVSYTSVTFDTETFDTNALHSTLSNTSRLTCVTAGLYRIYAVVRWGTESATSYTEAAIQLNGTTAIDLADDNGTTGTTKTQKLYTEYKLAVGDYVELVVLQGSGGDKTISSVATHFGMSLVK
jgi:hypothetical protein